MKQNLNTTLVWCMMAIFTTGLFSCNEEEKDNFPDIGNTLQIGVDGITTRALEDAFTAMDRIGLFAVSSPGSLLPSVNHADNIGFTLENEAENTWTPDEVIYYPATGNKLDLYAYYPYANPVFQTGTTVIPFRIHTDQRAYANYTNSDLLIAEKKGVSRSVNKVNLVFDHKLAQMAFALKAGDGFTVEDIKNAEITIVNAIIDATYDLAEGVTGIPVAGETKKDVLPTGEWLSSQNDASAIYGKKAIVIPQELNQDTYIQIKIGVLTFVKKFQEPITLHSGESRDFIITVNNRELEISTSLNPWNHGDPIEGVANEIPDAKVTLQWNEEKQVIEGFGISQASWAYHLWAHKKRDELMGWLFGEHGLRLNMLRGEIFPHYSSAPGVYDFDLDANVDVPFNDPVFTEVDLNELPSEALRRGQLWVTREAKKTFGIQKLIFSTWSPPAYMKTTGSAKNGGYLIEDDYPNFAEYLSEFCTALGSIGLQPYAVSPVNEPEFAAEWNSCRWSAGQVGKFLMNNMGPLFKEKHPDIQIYFGENGQWFFPGAEYLGIGSKTFVKNTLKQYPNLNQYVHIAAGHGYPIPGLFIDPEITPFTDAVAKGMKVWQTEISRPSDDGFRPGIDNGLSWAARYNKYLTKADVNAFLWWAGAQPSYTCETLIGIDDDRENYSFTKRYETFGNFTRYIKEGSVRVDIPTSGLPKNVDLSAYKNGDEYVIVMINQNNEMVSSLLTLGNVSPTGTLQRIVTDADNRWLETPEVEMTDDGYILELPPMSVVTFIGKAIQ